jgi:hypothetical protein
MQPATWNLQPATCNLEPGTCNLEPATCNLDENITKLRAQRLSWKNWRTMS